MTESLPQLSEVLGHHDHLVQYFRKQMMGWTQEHLAEALSVSVRWVQEMESMPFIRSLSRRKALAAILSIPPALLHLEGALFSLPGSRSQLSPSILESLEIGTRLRWQGYYARTNQVSEEGLLEEIEILEQLADDHYGAGRAERLVGRIRASVSSPVTVATKIVPTAYRWAPPPGTPIEHVYPPAHILNQVDESLRRLQLDCIDCVLFQTWCPTWTEPGAWYDTMLHLQQQGKIRTFGVSVSDHRADEANVLIASGFIDLVEVPYSVLDQRAATTLFPQALHSHASILVRSPLASCALAEDWRSLRFHRRDWRRRVFRGNQLDQTLRRVQQVRSVFGPDIPLAQGALRFCLSHPAVSTVIVGVREASHVLEACAAARCGPLPDDVLSQCSEHWQNEWCYEVRTSIGDEVERHQV